MSNSGPGGVDPEWAWKVAAILFVIGLLYLSFTVGLL